MNSLMEIQNIVEISDLLKVFMSNIIVAIIFSYTGVCTFVYLFKIKTTKLQITKLILLDSLSKLLCIIFINIEYCMFINTILTIVLFKLYLKPNIEKCFLGESINIIITISLGIFFSGLVYKELYINVITNYQYKIQFLFTISLSKVIILNIIKLNNFSITLKERFDFKPKCFIIMISSIGMIFTFVNIAKILLLVQKISSTILISDLIFTIIYFAISLKCIFQISRLEEQKIVIHNLESHNKTLSIMYDNLRGFKHDFSNFVQSLDGYVQTNDIDGIRSMNMSICKECRGVTNMGILDPSVINHPALYSLITNKYFLAREYNVSMNVEITFDLKEMDIDFYDLCTILGILLDNSIEASKECEKKIINVRFIKDLVTNSKNIIIENTYNNCEVDMEKIYEKGYSTKGDTKEHGLGLWNVKKLLKHNSNLKVYTTKGKLFCQKLEISDK